MKKIIFTIIISLICCQYSISNVQIQPYTQNSNLVDDYIDLARIYTSSAEYEKALEFIDIIDKISPKNPKIMYERAIILKNYNQPILSRNIMQEIAKIAPEYKESYLYKEFFKDEFTGFYMQQDYNSDYYTRKAEEAYKEEKYQKALDYFKKALKERKDSYTINNLGKAYLKTGNKKAALKCFEDAISHDITNPQSYINLALYYCDLEKNSKKQIQYLKHAIKLDPTNAEPFYLMGNIYFEKGMYETAIEYYRHSLTKNDLYFNAYYALGSTLFKLQNFEEAYFVFKKSLMIELDNEKIYEYLAKSAIELKKYEEAKSYAQKAVSIQPSPKNYELLVDALYNMGEYNTAITILNTKIADNKNSKMYNYLGLCYFQINSYKKAIDFFKKAINIEEKPIYFYNLAVCYNTIGENLNMNTYKEMALTTSPKEMEDYIDIIKIYNDLGQNDKILEILNKAIINYPNERKFYNYKLQLLQIMGKTKEYNQFKLYIEDKFPKEPLYLGKVNAKS